MSHRETREAIVSALDTSNTPVIAITGAWGTGKTFLWRDLSNSLEKDGVITQIYISALSYELISELKEAVTAKIVASLMPGNKLLDSNVVKKIVGLIRSFFPKDLNLDISTLYTFLPNLKTKLPSNLVLVVDDIERSEKIDITLLMGFLNYLIDNLNIKIILILNSNELGEEREAVWGKLREKIISREIELTISALDSIEIGLVELSDNNKVIFKKHIEKLKIKNIRILQHICRIWSSFEKFVDVDNADCVENISKSIVLLTALHYESLVGWPDIEKVIEYSNTYYRDDEEDEKDWEREFKGYGFGFANELEYDVLIPFLRTGHLKVDKLKGYVENITRSLSEESVRVEIGEFYSNVYWNQNVSKGDILEKISDLILKSDVISAVDITEIHKLAIKYKMPTSIHIIDKWLSSNVDRINGLDVGEHDFNGSYGNVHGKINQHFRKRYNELFPDLSLSEAINYCVTESGYGERHAAPIISADVNAFESLIIEGDVESYKNSCRLFKPIYQGNHRGTQFENSAKLFYQAVNNLIDKTKNDRLRDIWHEKIRDWG